MYLPPQFREDRADVLQQLIQTAPLATLIICSDSGMEANHVPLLLRSSPSGTLLVGHVARANPVWKRQPIGEALAIFSGPGGYISPSAYASKAEHGKVVPTWNYVAVHARGALSWIHDDSWLAMMLDELTAAHEATRPEPWRVSDAPAEFTAAMRRNVVGLELRVTRLEGKLKLSQNRSRADRAGVIAALRDAADPAASELAAAMEEALAT